MDKIQEVCDQYGFDDVMEMMEEYITDSVCPAICMNPDCDYTTDYEPDCQSGHCEVCGTPSCSSVMILMGVI